MAERTPNMKKMPALHRNVTWGASLIKLLGTELTGPAKGSQSLSTDQDSAPGTLPLAGKNLKSKALSCPLSSSEDTTHEQSS